jgi:hypothetical protein
MSLAQPHYEAPLTQTLAIPFNCILVTQLINQTTKGLF